jgi:hypothetical protein
LVFDFTEDGCEDGVAVAAHQNFKSAFVAGCIALYELGILNLGVQHS